MVGGEIFPLSATGGTVVTGVVEGDEPPLLASGTVVAGVVDGTDPSGLLLGTFPVSFPDTLPGPGIFPESVPPVATGT